MSGRHRAQKEIAQVSIAVIEKAFLILEGLTEEAEPVSLARLVKKTKLPKPTAYRILHTLVGLGYVMRNGGAEYCVTSKLDRLAQNARHSELKLLALPHMTKLHRQFNETVNLGVLEGLSIRYIHVLETTRPLRLMVHPNAVDEFYSTAVGRAIVASLPEQERESLLKVANLRPVTTNCVQTKAELRRLLDETRARGWGIDDEETVVGVICFGVALTKDGYPLGGISVSMPKTRLSDELRESIAQSLTLIGRSWDRVMP